MVVQPIQAQLVINEFMAANSSTINDPDFDESADWIELYNASNEEVDLTNHFLTDNLSEPNKWAFPAGTFIASHGFLMIWADGKNIGLHTSFKLSAEGEEIGLFDQNLHPVNTIIYPLQKTNISYGRYLDGGASWYWFSNASPGYSNNDSKPYEGITYYEPRFSVKGGFYHSELSLDLTSTGGEIHYTLDGSAPTLADPIYTQSIIIDQTSFVRARVFQSQLIPGPVITQSYFFNDSFEERELPVVSLVTHPEYFWSVDSGIYVQDFKPEWEYPLNIELFENDGNNRAVFNEKAGVKVNGRLSWQLPQKMLGIYFRNEYDQNSLDYPMFNDRERSSYNEIILRAAGSDWSQTLFRDGLGQEIAQDYTSIPHQGFRPCMVFINGEYLGIHNIRSRVDGDFIESNYEMEADTYDLIENDGNVDEGSEEQYLEMDALFHTDLSIENNFQALANLVDLEIFTNYWISEIWAANFSWGHNINLWKPHEAGKWQFIFADLDRIFIDPHLSINEFTVPLGDDYYDYGRYWLESIFQNDNYAHFFVQRFNDQIYTAFHPQRIHAIIDEFANTIDQEIPYHVEKWSGSTSNYGDGIESEEAWEEEIAVLKEFALERTPFMMHDLQAYFDMGPIRNLITACDPVDGGNIFINNFLIPSSPCQGPYFEDMAFQLSAQAKPGFQFQGWSATINKKLIQLEEVWKYHDLGEDLGSSWKETAYDDSSWSAGAAELGYGDGDESTVISYGSDEQDKHITTYFRNTFEYYGPQQSLKAMIKLRRDDGAIVYLNGQEMIRSNMPEGDIHYDTRALNNISGNAEDQLNEYILEDINLEEVNVIAVEIHQINSSSGDLSFDLSFSVSGTSEEIFSTEELVHITLSSDSGFMARYQPTGACLLAKEIAANTTLSIDCSPYLASEEVTILPNVSLSIDPGVEIWFLENTSMKVLGDLQVNGSESQPVLFKANHEYGAESWDILLFDHASDTSHLKYLEIREASQGLHPIHHHAALSILYSQVVMDHLLLDRNWGNPIYALHSTISLSNSLLHSEITGDLINVKYGDCLIDSCIFIGNDQVDTDAIDLDGVSNGLVKNSSIEKFYGSNSDGIDLGEECEDILIEHCFINEITDKGISIGQSSSATMLNNTITYCNLGVGIKDKGEGIINHNTFYSNIYAVSVFEKNPGAGGGKVNIINSILSNSSKSPLYFDRFSIGLSEQNIYDTDTMLGNNNIWMNPQFTNPNHYNFQLLPGSAAINAGLDGENLGAPFTPLVKDPKILISDLLYFHPYNPDKEFLGITNPGESTIDISNYELSGGIEFVFPQGVEIAAKEKILIAYDTSLFTHLEGQIYEWQSGHLANEGEKILLLDKHGMVIDHLRFLPADPWPELQNPGDYISLLADSLDNHFGENWTVGEPLEIYKEFENLNHLELFPNPCSAYVSVHADKTISNIQVFDILGREMLRETNNSSFIRININNLGPGVYFILINNNKLMKFIKQ